MSECYQDKEEWTDMEKEYKADDEGIEAEKDCGCDMPMTPPWPGGWKNIRNPAYEPPVHTLRMAMSGGGTARIEIPRDITLSDWQELERILNVLKPKQKRQRRKRR